MPAERGLAQRLGVPRPSLREARIVIEGSVALLAAARIQPDALVTGETILRAMEHAIDTGRNPIDQDRDFHVAIASNCGNAVLARMVANLFDERHSPISSKLQQRFGTAQARRLALAEHRAIFEALRGGDGLLAQSHMHIHLEASRRRWIENESMENTDVSPFVASVAAVDTPDVQ